MDAQVDRLAEKAWARYQDLAASQRLLIAIAGIPGSGKTTLALRVVRQLNERYANAHPSASQGSPDPVAALVPMDGFHLTRAQLAAMEDPKEAARRRGAAFTFDSAGYLKLVEALRAPLTPESSTIRAPSFDHAVKDPVADDIPIPTRARVVVFEGLYVAMGGGDWGRAADLMDEVWFVDIDEARAKRRLVARHVASGIEPDEAAAGRRADGNDLINGREINERLIDGVTERVPSIEDAAWAPNDG